MSQTLYDRIFDAHAVRTDADGTTLLYVDRHLLNEVTSPQAFESLQREGRPVWRPHANLAVADHNVPTTDRRHGIADPISKIQVDALRDNCERNGIAHYGMDDARQGIVHVVGPELGSTLPGMTIVCGDSHTSTHGALGALAFGIGTSEIEHVLGTQTLITRRSRTMRVTIEGALPAGCTAKDVALAVIGALGTAGGTGYAIEFAGPVVRALSMEGRMTLCNMSIEAGARAGLVAVDDTTLDYCRARPYAPQGDAWTNAERAWRMLRSDDDARFDAEFALDVSSLVPQVTWGTSPEMVTGIDGRVPDPADLADAGRRASYARALDYMGLEAGTRIDSIEIDKVFIGSCTNGRLDDLRAAAAVLRAAGGRLAPNVRLALAVPGSQQVKRDAEAEGLHEVFVAAGFEWREPGCSMCLAMNPDRLEPGERVASTSNRNFEGRQGAGGRSHLVSPAMAAAAALAGRFADVRQIVCAAGDR
ncbi:3-isopropylmalate dehydratase large subunit [Paraburkholderia caballeronis]|uniref:3-isopropylmalate dehydratase large subunit n=1 Tax=Paraburkholderia caballeronis TaxID=416943 RepID=UPI001065D1E5|nr:3-isopropylmalate dehydratase large subunit [Paraburkholderia caballeronis]TDV16617.1 3-isopropylmalate dehydratase large subunit [Paraburkholderia caballeronis]TDV19013.1 3-isopropylmalate dehydratase large subunit [Paraburkholderia caballeronis]TDV27146.1 3-isopropylmalate dehydratase large subunit [Paraburkholderia caballeronis]